MVRKVYKQLIEWNKRADRKPLILMGADGIEVYYGIPSIIPLPKGGK